MMIFALTGFTFLFLVSIGLFIAALIKNNTNLIWTTAGLLLIHSFTTALIINKLLTC